MHSLRHRQLPKCIYLPVSAQLSFFQRKNICPQIICKIIYNGTKIISSSGWSAASLRLRLELVNREREQAGRGNVRVPGQHRA